MGNLFLFPVKCIISTFFSLLAETDITSDIPATLKSVLRNTIHTIKVLPEIQTIGKLSILKNIRQNQKLMPGNDKLKNGKAEKLLKNLSIAQLVQRIPTDKSGGSLVRIQ